MERDTLEKVEPNIETESEVEKLPFKEIADKDFRVMERLLKKSIKDLKKQTKQLLKGTSQR